MMKNTKMTDEQYWELNDLEEKTSITLGDALSWFDTEELKVLKADLTDNMVERLKSIPKPLKPKDKTIAWLERTLYEYRVNQILKHYSHVSKRIIGKLKATDFKVTEESVTQEHIDRAREYPIEQLIDTPIRQGMTLCPFHNEDTPSMSVGKYNRYNCFGCGAKGDVIKFYMKQNNTDFLTSVRILCGLV